MFLSGPNFDHTTGLSAGHYLLHPADTATSSAKLTSLVLSQTEAGSCKLRFYYFMYGDNVGKLTVGTTQYGGNGTENVSTEYTTESSIMFISIVDQ